MKQGRTLQDLASELQRRQESKEDFLADTSAVSVMTNDDGVSRLLLNSLEKQFQMTTHATRQVEDRLKIPSKFAERLRTRHHNAYDGLVNYLFRAEPEERLVRCLDSKARAFLSNRYQRIDDYDVANVALPILSEQPDMQVISCDVTDSRLYIKALFPRIEREVTRGDVVQAGVVIANSEIGAGSVRVEPLVYRLVCLNGMISSTALKRHHVGRALELTDGRDASEVFKSDTQAAADEAFMLKLRDVVRASADVAYFETAVNELRETTERVITGDPIKVVEATQRRFNLSETEKSSVLTHLIQGGDLTQYGLLNAITRASQDVEDYDRATDLERVGGNVVELPQKDWVAIAAGKADDVKRAA